MKWQPINTIPNTGKQVLVGFMTQFEWYTFVAIAKGDNTAIFMPYAKPTHWTPIIPPKKEDLK